ncbi:hypothetical protein O181_081849 [Austropuccinia psidii MF-1]|uniref:L-lactate dehydrogenase (cytochrome) n=1 Tax=Austropuccinia psidii MF-1 TaxID=1389203 RepID=A0A9Q3FNL0_9BASI|nr:hypothetical protein [Austropuccinia psidii MF-1]
MKTFLSLKEIQQHSNSRSCWVIIHDQVYDLTDFLPHHPGGKSIILKYAGSDASQAYEPFHPPGTIEEYLPKQYHLGEVDPSQLKDLQVLNPKNLKINENLKEDSVPALSTCLSLYDFESVAKTRISRQAWAYYSSGSDDEVSMRENSLAFQRIWFRPRILINVSQIDFSTSLLGHRTSMPIYITATALGKLGHPDGEKNLTWGAGNQNVIQMIPTLSSFSFEELIRERKTNQVQWLQVYVNSDRTKTENLIKKAEENGIQGLFITVDAPQLGRREKDMRLKFEDFLPKFQEEEGSQLDRSQGAARAISNFIDPSLSWNDLAWFQKITKMPIILKGVQTWEDAILAREQGLRGIVLSNHGGRQLDYARSGIEILVEVVEELKKRKLWNPEEFEVFVDGGIRRAGDILKALCLGAKGVGIGRPFLYAYSVYGVKGVNRAIEILKDELEMNMRLIGARKLDELRPEMVDLSNLKNRVNEPITNFKFRQNYEPLPQIKATKL